MLGKNLLEGRTGPQTQSVEAVKALLSWKGRAVDPLPATVEFIQEGEDSRLILILSNKKDTYYTCTPRTCSCPAKTYNPGQPCKHQRKHFGASMEQAKTGGIRPDMNGFKPVDSIPGEERVAKAAPSMLIDLHDTSDREAAYHSIREDKIMWQAEA